MKKRPSPPWAAHCEKEKRLMRRRNRHNDKASRYWHYRPQVHDD